MNKRSDKPKQPTAPKKTKHKNQKEEKVDESGCADRERDLQLSRKDAASASPANASVGGEEDAGAGLEFLVKKNKK